MNSPYDVLGISPFASEDEIRAAYKKLAAKYGSSPEKLEKLNAAYDEIIISKRKAEKNNTPQNAVSEFSDVRRLISNLRLNDAEEILDGIRSLSRGGEWNYLKALVLFKRGLLNEALHYIERSLEKDSLNSEAAELYKKILGGSGAKKANSFLFDLIDKLRKGGHKP